MDNAGVSEPVAVSQQLKGAGRGHSSRAGGSLLYVVFFMERVRARGCPPTWGFSLYGACAGQGVPSHIGFCLNRACTGQGVSSYTAFSLH